MTTFDLLGTAGAAGLLYVALIAIVAIIAIATPDPDQRRVALRVLRLLTRGTDNGSRNRT